LREAQIWGRKSGGSKAINGGKLMLVTRKWWGDRRREKDQKVRFTYRIGT